MQTQAEAVQTSVPSSITSVTLVAANRRRKRLFIANTSTAILFIRLDTAGVAATMTTGHSIQMAANTNLELVGFTGAVTGIWAAANGQANLTEIM
jgi:hypothetical protein